VRLVELTGQSGTVKIAFPGEITAAFRTNLMGEQIARLEAEPVKSPVYGPLSWQQVTLSMRGNEIATLYLDLAQGRKTTRDLGSFRSVWADIPLDYQRGVTLLPMHQAPVLARQQSPACPG